VGLLYVHQPLEARLHEEGHPTQLDGLVGGLGSLDEDGLDPTIDPSQADPGVRVETARGLLGAVEDVPGPVRDLDHGGREYPGRVMCRSIVQLRRPDSLATDEEIRAAALQFVRKVSGYRNPSRRNLEAFDRAVDEVAAASGRLLEAVSQAR
jgi:hypothetical protein